MPIYRGDGKNNMRMFRIIGIIAMIFAMSGCSSKGPSVVPASGQLLGADGKPVEGVNLLFWPQQDAGYWKKVKTIPFGLTGSQGEFEVYLFSTPGVPPGRYRVTATPVADKARAAIPDQFRRDNTTPWEVTIPKSGDTRIMLRIQ